MKRLLSFLLITSLALSCFSQTKFEQGYFINNENKIIECFIKNLDWKNNPRKFEYKFSNTSESLTATIEEVKEFCISNTHKYVRLTVDIDRSSDNIDHLDKTSTIILNEEQLFLKAIIEGNATLYSYEDEQVKRFFYKVDNSNVTQLIYKRYNNLLKDNLIRENNGYKQQLWVNLKCPNISLKDIEILDYKIDNLIKVFEKYNAYVNSETFNYKEKIKKDLFNLTIRPGINNSSLLIKFENSSTGDIDFGNSLSFRFGIESEFILPFNNNKWAILIEPTYQYFNSENRNHGQLIVADYKSIELPIGIRHYFFLNDKSKLFINAVYISDFKMNSRIKFEEDQYNALDYGNILKIIGKSNFAIGCGYNHSNKYSLEMRYSSNREILAGHIFWNSKYNTLSVIFGYSIF